MDPVVLLVAFSLGFLAHALGLPPLVGFLVAGFLLGPLGIEAGRLIHELSGAGVTLLMFTIGLKLRLGTLAKPEVWGGASLHLVATVAVLGLAILGLAAADVSLFGALDVADAALLAFAASFSSTVFAFKILEDKGELNALHGRVAIGILIMQDLFAVLFLSLSAETWPSPWAPLLLLIVPLRPVLCRILARSGHGELLLLAGLSLAFGVGYWLFEAFGVKGDLGALLVGVLIGSHPKGHELSKAMLGLKDVLLVGFFLEVGLARTLTPETVLLALLLVALLPLKMGLYFAVLTRFRLRARTGTLTSLSLANYSEFGLIVGAVALDQGWLAAEWVIALAIALSLSFALASPLNAASHALYRRLAERLARFERKRLHAEEQPIDTGEAQVLVFGMGRVGTATYDVLVEHFGERVLGLDCNETVVARHAEAGRQVRVADATDPDFWNRLRPHQVELVMLTMNGQNERLFAARQLEACHFRGRVDAIARYADERDELVEAGVERVYSFYEEAGAGLAQRIREHLAERRAGPEVEPAPAG